MPSGSSPSTRMVPMPSKLLSSSPCCPAGAAGMPSSTRGHTSPPKLPSTHRRERDEVMSRPNRYPSAHHPSCRTVASEGTRQCRSASCRCSRVRPSMVSSALRVGNGSRGAGRGGFVRATLCLAVPVSRTPSIMIVSRAAPCCLSTISTKTSKHHMGEPSGYRRVMLVRRVSRAASWVTKARWTCCQKDRSSLVAELMVTSESSGAACCQMDLASCTIRLMGRKAIM
mmetsp:Transcript_44680/g.126246  ORF Transcript_44680/g.126246 Transcript_44680/m.126246 type:complete len:227 (+) Transcript_44680:509-1189(+)